MRRVMIAVATAFTVTTAVAGGSVHYAKPQIKKYDPSLANFYMGMILGYADADWSSVVAMDQDNQLTTPLAAKGDGTDYGVFFGWQPIDRFALELSYIRLPDSFVAFNTFSLDQTFNSDMYMGTGVMKLILPMPKYDVSIYGLVGGAYLHREDPMLKGGDWSVIFGAGFRHNLNKRWFAEMQFMYTPGFGESILQPITKFLPEVYTINLRLGYNFL